MTLSYLNVTLYYKTRTMEAVRRCHNDIKRSLIQHTAKSGMRVLDVGCGFGGDLKKWTSCGVKLSMCDPSYDAISEAKKRASDMNMTVRFYNGDISVCPRQTFDIICFNFSLQYIFSDQKYFFKNIYEIKKRLKKGGKLIGCIPNSDFILLHETFQDDIGNYFIRNGDTGYGQFGEKNHVYLADTPYYNDGPKSEPIAYKDLLVTHLEKMGIQLQSWTPFQTEYKISKMYSQFIFVNI